MDVFLLSQTTPVLIQAAFTPDLVLNRRFVQNQLENFVKEQRDFVKQYEVTNEKEHIAQTADEKLQNQTDEFLLSHNRQNTDSNHLCQLPPAFQKCEIKTQKAATAISVRLRKSQCAWQIQIFASTLPGILCFPVEAANRACTSRQTC